MEKKRNNTELNNENYQNTLLSKNLIVLEFYTEWMGSCRIISPTLRELAAQYAELQVEFYRVDADKYSEIARDYGINYFPTILFIKNGQVVDFIYGIEPKSEIETKINYFLKTC